MSDLISRQEAFDEIIWNSDNGVIDAKVAIEALRKLPSVEPERKTGHWVLLSDDEAKKDSIFWLYCSTAWMNYKCSSCGKIVHNRLMGHEENRTKYCPSCGSYNGGVKD